MLDHPALQRRFTPAHHQLRARARAFFAALDLERWLNAPGGFLTRALWRELGRQGFLGLSLPPALGGQGLGALGALIMNEALAQLDDVGPSLGMHIQNEITAYWLATTLQEHLRQRYLPLMLIGEVLGCTCDTDLSPERPATAVADGDKLVVNARKAYIVNAVNADLCFVSLSLDGQMATVLVEKDRPGVRISKIFDKLGTRAIDSVLLDFEDVRVPRSNVVSRQGVQQLMHWNMVMTRARFLIAADACFIHAAALRRMLHYGTQRRVGDKLLLRWPINRHLMARAQGDQLLMQAGILRLLARLDDGRYPVPDAAAVKWFCVDRALQLTIACAEMEGGAGYMRDSPFLNAYAQLRGLTMAGGTQTTMKVVANGALACQEELAAPAAPPPPTAQRERSP